MNHNQIIHLARQLRKNQTPAEKIIWANVRGRKFKNKKFLRQHPIIFREYENDIEFIIADFYCNEHKLILEIDGKIHDYQKEHDKQRDLVSKEMGYLVLRIKNEQVMTDMKEVKEKIKNYF